MAPRWVLLCRFLALPLDDAEGEEPAADFSFAIRAPPRVSFLTAARRVHPNPNYIGEDAYLIAAGASGVLFGFVTTPLPDADGRVDHELVVARHFLPAAAGQARSATSTASADRILRRAASMPYAIGFIGLVSLHDGNHYLIVELRIDSGSDRAKLHLFFAGHEEWDEIQPVIPVEAQGRTFVSIGGVLAHDDHLWWVDLSWGLLSCNPVADEPTLVFHALPPNRVRLSYYPKLHDQRCVCESNNRLRFVEIIRGRDDLGRKTTFVCMWTRIPAPDGSGKTARWDKVYQMSFPKIWNDDSYKATMLPPKVPAVVVVSPSNYRVVYFFLPEQKCLFGVDVPEHEVVEFVTEDLPGDTEPPTDPASNFRILPWILPPSISEDLVEVAAPFVERCASTSATPERC